MRDVDDHTGEKHVPLLFRQGAIHQQPYDPTIGPNHTVFQADGLLPLFYSFAQPLLNPRDIRWMDQLDRPVVEFLRNFSLVKPCRA